MDGSRRCCVLRSMALVSVLACTGFAHASVIAPALVELDVTQMCELLKNEASGGMAPARDHRDSLPHSPQNDGRRQELFNLLKQIAPSNSSSSTSGSSLTIGSGAFGVLESHVAIRDDSPVGRLAEERGLWLPDAPANDMLRPPRAV